MEYNPLNIPDFDAGTYKGCAKKRRFRKLILDPFNAVEAIVCHYTEWIVMPDGTTDREEELVYTQDIAELEEWFNLNPTATAPNVPMGMIILGGINNKLNSLDNPPVEE